MGSEDDVRAPELQSPLQTFRATVAFSAGQHPYT